MRPAMKRAALTLCFALFACSHKNDPLPGAVANGPPPASPTPAPNAAPLELRLEGSAAFLTPAEIASCTSQRDGGNALLHCTLNTAGKDKLAEVTGANIGKVLEMVVEGTVRLRPEIQQAITGGELTIWIGDDAKAAAEADRLAAALSGR